MERRSRCTLNGAASRTTKRCARILRLYLICSRRLQSHISSRECMKSSRPTPEPHPSRPDRLRGRPVRPSLSGFDLETLGLPRAAEPGVGFGLDLLDRLLVICDPLGSKSLQLGVFVHAADVHALALIGVGV